MKKHHAILLLAAAALGGAISCNKSAPTPDAALLPDGPKGVVNVTIALPEEPETKAASTEAKEFRINRFQVIIFNKATGAKETDIYKEITAVDNQTSITLTTLTGEKSVWAIVNSPRLSEATETKLKAHISDLNENTHLNLVMSGQSDVTVTEYDANKGRTTTTPVTVNVTRLGARISLESVKVDFTGTALEGATFAISQIYMKNVVGKQLIDRTGLSASQLQTTGNWYNKLTLVSGEASAAIVDTFSKSCPTNGTATSIGRYLYVYPNPTAVANDSNGDTFTPRLTRLVIKAHVTGGLNDYDDDTFYTFDMPVIEGNHTYKIASIKITQLGKPDDDDDKKTLVGKVEATIKVSPWGPEHTLNFEM